MRSEQAHGINKAACRRDTYNHIRHLLGGDTDRTFGVLLGPEAGDVPAIIEAGFTGRIKGFEYDEDKRRKAKKLCKELDGGHRVDVFGDACVPYSNAKHTDAFYDWCDGVENGWNKTERALRANFVPREFSTVTVGITTRGNPAIIRARWERDLAGCKYDASLATARYLHDKLARFMHECFSMYAHLEGVRDYKGLCAAGENRGAHMVYATFQVTSHAWQAQRLERVHYTSSVATDVETPLQALRKEEAWLRSRKYVMSRTRAEPGTATALKAVESRRINARLKEIQDALVQLEY